MEHNERVMNEYAKLAPTSAPLVLKDGTKIDPATGKRIVEGVTKQQVEQMIEVPPAIEAQRLVINARRKIADLPAVPNTMNAVSVVLAYSMFGLSDDEIAVATKLTVDQVTRMKASPIYEQYSAVIVENLMHSDTENVRNLFAAHTRAAVSTLVAGLTSPKATDRLKAADSLLDRAGHRPADIVQHNHIMGNELRIVVVEKNERDQGEIIDLPVSNEAF